MMNSKSSKLAAVTLTCLGMLISPATLSAAPMAAPRDVALGEGGILDGQVVNNQGVPSALTTITLADHQQEIARTRTDQEGKFSVSGLRGGVYRISSHGQVAVYRLWAPNTAPPVAQQGVTLVAGNDVVRGQYGTTAGPFGSMAQWVADHPLITASAIGAAIAIPIALNDDDDWTPPASP